MEDGIEAKKASVSIVYGGPSIQQDFASSIHVWLYYCIYFSVCV